MKKLLLIFIPLTMSVMMIAQEKPKQQEVGLVFNNFDNFGITYKIGTEKSLWRFNSLFMSGSNMDDTSDSLATNSSSMGFGIKFGKEYRKIIIENFELRYGADLAFSYNKTTAKMDDKTVTNRDRISERITFRPGINLVFGFNYLFKDHFIIGAELLPHFTYYTGTAKENDRNNDEVVRDISGYSYGLSSTSALISFSYRF